jgi:hypothetical protein
VLNILYLLAVAVVVVATIVAQPLVVVALVDLLPASLNP